MTSYLQAIAAATLSAEGIDWPLVIAMAAAPLTIYYSLLQNAKKVAQPEKLIRSMDVTTKVVCAPRMAPIKPFLDSIGMAPVTEFVFEKIAAFAYEQKGTGRHIIIQFSAGKMSFDIATACRDGKAIETTTSGASGIYPHPHAYVQSLPGLWIEKAWERHLEAEQWATMKLGLVPAPTNEPFMTSFCNDVRRQMQHNLAQSFLPVRILYRYFVTRHRIAGKKLWQRYR